MPKPRKIRAKQPELDGAGMSPLAQAHLQKFKRWLKEDMAEVETTPLVVLVWGPGESGGDLYQKRLQIRDMLRGGGDAALFSEELDALCAGFKGSARAKELIQANRADFIIVLYGSPGSIAEAHDFGFFDVLGSKMLVCVDSRHVDGFGYKGLLTDMQKRFNNVHEYAYPEDIRDCHLMTALEERLETFRVGKWWAVRLGRA
jgi:hypothetical protein